MSQFTASPNSPNPKGTLRTDVRKLPGDDGQNLRPQAPPVPVPHMPTNVTRPDPAPAERNATAAVPASGQAAENVKVAEPRVSIPNQNPKPKPTNVVGQTEPLPVTLRPAPKVQPVPVPSMKPTQLVTQKVPETGRPQPQLQPIQRSQPSKPGMTNVARVATTTAMIAKAAKNAKSIQAQAKPTQLKPLNPAPTAPSPAVKPLPLIQPSKPTTANTPMTVLPKDAKSIQVQAKPVQSNQLKPVPAVPQTVGPLPIQPIQPSKLTTTKVPATTTVVLAKDAKSIQTQVKPATQLMTSLNPAPVLTAPTKPTDNNVNKPKPAQSTPLKSVPTVRVPMPPAVAVVPVNPKPAQTQAQAVSQQAPQTTSMLYKPAAVTGPTTGQSSQAPQGVPVVKSMSKPPATGVPPAVLKPKLEALAKSTAKAQTIKSVVNKSNSRSKSRSKSKQRQKSKSRSRHTLAQKSKSKSNLEYQITKSRSKQKSQKDQKTPTESLVTAVKLIIDKDKSGGDVGQQFVGVKKSRSKPKKGKRTNYSSFQPSQMTTSFSTYPVETVTTQPTKVPFSTKHTGENSESKKPAQVRGKVGQPSTQQNNDCSNNNFDLLNYGVMPARTTAFKAPFVPLCDAGPPGGQVTLDENGNVIESDEDGVNFSFKPRPNFATEVTFTVEPRKKPTWQTMMNCGFTPMIYCNVPPYCLPDDRKQQPAYRVPPEFGYNYNNEESSSSSDSDSSSGSDTSGCSGCSNTSGCSGCSSSEGEE